MQNGRIQMNMAQPNLRLHLSDGVRVAAARRFCGVSLFLCSINVELTMLSAGLMLPPPALHLISIILHKMIWTLGLCYLCFLCARSVLHGAFRRGLFGLNAVKPNIFIV